MKLRERILLVVVVVLIAGTAGALRYLKSHQRLGRPGVRVAEVPGSLRMRIEMTTNVAGFACEELPVSTNVTDKLPADTSMRQMVYQDAEGPIQVFVVLMGSDRTSIHRPQFCLTGDGWTIDDARSEVAKVRLLRPRPLDLPVNKLIATKTRELDGKPMTTSGVYVYWFVAGNAVTTDHNQIMTGIAKHLLTTGELQRWSYITYFAQCHPGNEARAFARIQRLMNATVPEFQLAWPAEER